MRYLDYSKKTKSGFKIKETDKAWLAAALDADGTVLYQLYTKRNKGRKFNIIIVNTNLEFVKQAAKIMHGIIHQFKTGKDKVFGYYRRKKIIYHARICSRETVLYIAKSILKYSIVKREKLGKVITFLETYGYRKRTESQRELRSEILKKIWATRDKVTREKIGGRISKSRKRMFLKNPALKIRHQQIATAAAQRRKANPILQEEFNRKVRAGQRKAREKLLLKGDLYENSCNRN